MHVAARLLLRTTQWGPEVMEASIPPVPRGLRFRAGKEGGPHLRPVREGSGPRERRRRGLLCSQVAELVRPRCVSQRQGGVCRKGLKPYTHPVLSQRSGSEEARVQTPQPVSTQLRAPRCGSSMCRTPHLEAGMQP